MNTGAKITQMWLIYRYDEIDVNRVTGLSSHMVLDHSNDMLYICDKESKNYQDEYQWRDRK